MQDEGITNDGNGQSSGESTTPPNIAHVYYEVGTDVLSKPNALCDLLEVTGCPPSAIFCNVPSDADLVEVILKKRGIAALKLIGHVPPMRCSRALKQVKSGEVSCLVITDVSGQSIDVEELDLVINYSLPTLPEVYIHRCGHTRPGQKLSKVISLIGALDIANLHYLKKVVEFDLQKGELPTKEQLSASAITKLSKQAVETASMNDARILGLTKQILSDEHRDDLVALLLRNTLDLIPALQASQSRAESEEEGGDRAGDRSGDRDERGGDRGDRGDDRGGQDDRWGRRGGRGGRGRNDNRNNYDNEGGDRSYGDRSFGDQGGDGQRDYGEDRRDNRSRERSSTPPEKNARIYVGQGTTHGLTADKLSAMLAEQCNLTPDKIKASKIRSHYSFIDIPEEGSDAIVNTLNAGDGNKQIFARKAITVSVSRGEAMPTQSEGMQPPVAAEGEI